MYNRIIKKLLSCCLVVTLVFVMVACGKNQNTVGSQNVGNNPTLSNDTGGNAFDDVIVEDLEDDDEIIFSDFLVERCVRKTLNKSWADKITKAEAAGIKSLLIDNIYNPSIGISFGAALSSFTFYEGYIDLVDLKYLTGLEILKVDNYVNYDMVVNLDSICNCKELKKLYIQCNPRSWDPYSGIGYGYRYWADIIAELPKLEYVDMGVYIDSHMKEIMLSKTSNKQITFYNGYNDRYANQVLDTVFSMYPNPMIITDIKSHESAMKYEYNGSDIIISYDSVGTIQVLDIKNGAELTQAINNLSESIEDLCIRLWMDCSEFDCSILSRFKNLSTLTIVKSGVTLRYKDKSKCLSLMNIDRLSELPYLQVVNLGGCRGDISALSKVKKLRELTLSYCNVDAIDFLADMDELVELKLFDSDFGSLDGQFKSSDNNLNKLKYYKCYGDSDEMSVYMTLTKYMPKLQTLFVDTDIPDISILKTCTELENLMIYGCVSEIRYDIKAVLSLRKLKTICITNQNSNVVNVQEILNLPNIVSVVIPSAVKNMDSTTLNASLQRAATHSKLSMFEIIDGYSCNYTEDDIEKFNVNSLRGLYDKGISDGLIQARIMMRYGIKEKNFEQGWSDVPKFK